MISFTVEELQELRGRYGKLYSGVVYDALHEDVKPFMPYVLSRKIKPAWDFDEVLCGPAFTVQGAIITDAIHAHKTSAAGAPLYIDMLNSLYSGCVEMISSGIDNKISVFGEITAKIASRHGAVGTIIDACARDIKGLKTDGYKVFSQGSSMIDTLDRWHIVNYQIPLPFDGEDGDVWINPGDYIFADCDGVLVIPNSDVWKVLQKAEGRIEKENRIRESIKNGVAIREILEKEGRW